MKRVIYRVGKTLQLVALLTLPSAIWIAHFNHDEKGAIGVFLGSFVVFVLGYFLTRGSLRA